MMTAIKQHSTISSKDHPTTVQVSLRDIQAFRKRKEAARISDRNSLKTNKDSKLLIQKKNSMFSSSAIRDSKVLSYPSF